METKPAIFADQVHDVYTNQQTTYPYLLNHLSIRMHVGFCCNVCMYVLPPFLIKPPFFSSVARSKVSHAMNACKKPLLIASHSLMMLQKFPPFFHFSLIYCHLSWAFVCGTESMETFATQSYMSTVDSHSCAPQLINPVSPQSPTNTAIFNVLILLY